MIVFFIHIFYTRFDDPVYCMRSWFPIHLLWIVLWFDVNQHLRIGESAEEKNFLTSDISAALLETARSSSALSHELIDPCLEIHIC